MIHLSSYLTVDDVHLDVAGDDKATVLIAVGKLLAGRLDTLTAGDVTGLLTDRENLASTGVGLGVAIPHASTAAIAEPCLGLFRTAVPVPFDSVDGVPVRLMVVVLAPKASQALHLRILARIARLVRDPATRERLLAAPTPADVCAIIGDVEGIL